MFSTSWRNSVFPAFIKISLLVVVGLLLAGWLIETPPGLLGKADAVGYAVCHRIAERSFSIGDRQFSLCARCTGMFLGALVGLIYQVRRGRLGGMPSLKFYIFIGLCVAAFGVDGLNSYVQLVPNMGLPHLYESQNYLRVLTGSGMGLGIAIMLYPVYNQTLWRNFDQGAGLRTWRDLGGILLLAILVDLLTMTNNPLLLYPLSVLGSGGVLVILSMVYTMVWIMLFKRDNTFIGWKDVLYYYIGGCGTALLQIALMDAGRYFLTGTWNGFFS